MRPKTALLFTRMKAKIDPPCMLGYVPPRVPSTLSHSLPTFSGADIVFRVYKAAMLDKVSVHAVKKCITDTMKTTNLQEGLEASQFHRLLCRGSNY